MALPAAWLAGLDAIARESLGKAEAHVEAREAAGVEVYPPGSQLADIVAAARRLTGVNVEKSSQQE